MMFGSKTAEIQKIILECGFHEAGVIPVDKLTFHEEVREMCKGNQCGCYGTTWACPPATGSLEECRNRVMQYDFMHLFSKAYTLEDFLDVEGMQEGMKEFKKAARILDQKLRGNLERMQILSNESCDRCRVCTYPDEACRFPDDLHHSIEGYGFYVNELAKLAGINYMNGPDTVTYFGAVLY